MSKNLTSLQTQLAAHEVFGQFRYIVIDGEIYFVAVDVCKILGYKNSRKAIADHVDDEDKNTVTIRDGIPGNPNKVIINESGLYSLIFGSNLPQSKKFTRWVTSEVLPSIRKTGSYSIAPKGPDRPKKLLLKIGLLLFWIKILTLNLKLLAFTLKKSTDTLTPFIKSV